MLTFLRFFLMKASLNIWHLFLTIRQIFPKIIVFSIQQNKIWKKAQSKKGFFGRIFTNKSGPESDVTDFVTMTNDPVTILPDKFTICSSLFIDVMTTLQNIFQILKEDGTYWFSISYDQTRHALMFCQNMKYKYVFSVKDNKV